jgi:hypothetical protein
MMGPDFVQWHGFYELSRNFYTHFLPLAIELAEKKGKGEQAKKVISEALHGPNNEDWEKYHRWTEAYLGQMESLLNGTEHISPGNN